MRYCAFCLEVLSGSLIKNCSKCKKRAYCSKECQQKDWSVTGNGQRHKNWCCIYEYGEEDVDWEIFEEPVKSTRPREALTKKTGIRAKKLIPIGYNIVVEPVFTDPHGHPGII